jgi:hypothetical protein
MVTTPHRVAAGSYPSPALKIRWAATETIALGRRRHTSWRVTHTALGDAPPAFVQ